MQSKNKEQEEEEKENMPILTIQVLPSFTTPWYGHEKTKNAALSEN